MDAICHVVRAFQDANVTHVDGSVDPMRDAEVIGIELAMADMATVARRAERLHGKLKAGRSKELDAEEALLKRLENHLNEGRFARELEYTDDEHLVMRELSLLDDEADDVCGKHCRRRSGEGRLDVAVWDGSNSASA